MLKYIISAITGALIAVLLMRGCDSKPITLYDTHKSDSVIAKSKRDSVQYVTHIAVLQSIIDDKTDLADSIYLSLSDKLERNQFTLAKLRTAKAGKDTITFVQSCDTLVAEYNALVDQGLHFKYERDTLIDALRKTKTIDSLHNIAQDETKMSLIGSLNDATEIAKKFKAAAGKHWSIGPSAGYGSGKNGLTPFAGVSVNYSLLRF